MQAAYFRRVLTERRADLDADLGQVQQQIQTAVEAGDRVQAHMLRRQLRGHEQERRQLDRLIAGLDRRFAAVWVGLDAELG
jgi:DNA-binding ferritin-like protein